MPVSRFETFWSRLSASSFLFPSTSMSPDAPLRFTDDHLAPERGRVHRDAIVVRESELPVLKAVVLHEGLHRVCRRLEGRQSETSILSMPSRSGGFQTSHKLAGYLSSRGLSPDGKRPAADEIAHPDHHVGRALEREVPAPSRKEGILAAGRHDGEPHPRLVRPAAPSSSKATSCARPLPRRRR